jgi:5-methylcytosine-specific restriction endonuclease McrA
MTKSSKIRRKDRLFREQEGVCVYCKKEMKWDVTAPVKWKGHPDEATVDHVTPRSKGGSNFLKNIVVCCFDCNARKADKTLIQFLVEESQRERDRRAKVDKRCDNV